MAGLRVLITGGTGMVGRNLREHPAAQAHEVLAPTRGELDLTDRAATEAYVREARPDVILHAAGRVGGIQANMAHPVEFLVENLDMGRNVVMAARAAGVPRMINFGSSCMYPRAAANPLKEDLILKGELEPTNEGYAIAKIATARLCRFVSETGPYAYKTAIPTNLYGRHDKFDPKVSHMVPAVLAKLATAIDSGEDTVEIWGDGTARREFMLASDCAEAVWWALERFDALPDVFNIGLGHDFSINDYYRAAAEVTGFRGRFVHDLSKPVGMKQKLLDVSVLSDLGWRAPTSLADGLAETFRFYRTLPATAQVA